MRSCIYCGRELADGEQCSCKAAVARRMAKQTADGSEKAADTSDAEKKKKKEENKESSAKESEGKEKTGEEKASKESGRKSGKKSKKSKYEPINNGSNGYYRTGYTDNDSRFKRQWNRFKTQCAERRNRAKNPENMRSVFAYLWRFIKSPIDEAANAKLLSSSQILIMTLIQGAIIGMGIYFVSTGASRSWFRALANLIGFGGVTGYKMLGYALLSAFTGAIGGTVLYGIYTLVFWAMGKLAFRSQATYHEMAQRLVFTTVPFTLISAIGVCFAFFSTTTLMVMMVCGAVSSVIITYTALNEEWISASSSRVFYSVLAGYFVLITFICALLRISIIGG